MNTTLAKTLNWEKETDYLDLDLTDLVESAGKVIVPLGPISTFAARSPWAGLEENLFETVARRLKDTCDVDIYPGESMFQAALSQGDIQPDFLKIALKNW